MIYIALTLICCFAAGAANGVMDALQFHGIASGNPFWDPKLSWERKYREIGDNWWANLIEDLDNTILSWTTDGWHLVKFFWLTIMTFAIVLATQFNLTATWHYIALFVAVRLSMSAGFSLTYKVIFKRKM